MIGKEFELNRPRYFQILLQRRRRVDQDIGAPFHCALVSGSGSEVPGVRNIRTTDCGARGLQDRMYWSACPSEELLTPRSVAGVLSWPARPNAGSILYCGHERGAISSSRHWFVPITKSLTGLGCAEIVGNVLEKIVVPAQSSFVLIKRGAGRIYIAETCGWNRRGRRL